MTTLDELNRLGSKAEATKLGRERATKAAQSLAKLRNSEAQTPTSNLVVLFSQRWGFGSDEVARKEFFAVLDEFQADLLRIAEMRLEAKARALGQQERALRAQVAGFLGEGDEIAARERT